jgi:hypothetical protein
MYCLLPRVFSQMYVSNIQIYYYFIRNIFRLNFGISCQRAERIRDESWEELDHLNFAIVATVL